MHLTNFINFKFKIQLNVPKESEIGFKITELQNEVSQLDKYCKK